MSVIIQMWKRLEPSRTKKLSTSWVMILRLTGRGKVAHCGLCFMINLQFILLMGFNFLSFCFMGFFIYANDEKPIISPFHHLALAAQPRLNSFSI